MSAQKKPTKKPLGRFLIEFVKDMTIAKKGQKYFVTEEQSNVLVKQGKAKLVKEYTEKEIDSLSEQKKIDELLAPTKASK